MPPDPGILGFSNPWYPGAIKSATIHNLAPNLSIRVVTPPYFCATKIVGVSRPRGWRLRGQPRSPRTFLLLLMDAASSRRKIRLADEDVRRHIAAEVSRFLRDGRFIDALPGCLPPDGASQARLPLLAQRLHEIAAIQ
jgi:hypothetical protein